jgi:glycosyltransferase involved in cell wall biosynthesis
MEYSLKGESIVCFAGENWWYHHPHSKNHILKRLSGQNRVLFVNSIGMGLPSPSNPDFFLKIRRKVKSYFRWYGKVPNGPHVLTPVSLPFYGSNLARRINRVLLLAQVRLAMLFCRIRRPVLWVCIPFAADVVDGLGAKLLLYHVSDKYEANQDGAVSRSVIQEFDRKLKDKSALVMYSGRKLYEESEVPHRYFLEQAVDFDHFATEARETAPDIALIPRPILGYIGWIDYIMDVPLIEEVARLRPDWHWVFIGRKSNLVQISAANVHFLGPKPYAELPAYLRHIDVCVLPWRTDNEFTSYGSAIKVREYLASGKPVVMAPLYEYLGNPGIRTYRSAKEFIAAVDDVLSHDNSSQREVRQNSVRDCTWDSRTEELSGVIASLLRNGRSGVQA